MSHLFRILTKLLSVKIAKTYFASFIIGNVLGQLNPSLESGGVPPPGWTEVTGIGTWQTTTTNVRSGSRCLYTASNSSMTREITHNTYIVNVPSSGTNYVHAICWIRGNSGSVTSFQAAIGIRGTNSATSSKVQYGTSYQRITASTGVATNNGNCYPYFLTEQVSSSSLQHRADDFIIYSSTSSSVDLSKPNSPSALNICSSGNDNVLTWTDGTDVATNTSGIDGALILRALAGTALPTLLDQAYYSSNSAIGPNTIGSWSVLSNGSSIGTYTDAGAVGTPYIYAVYMRDKAFNYSSSPATFTTANAGNDQNLACAATTATLTATASTGGVWSVSAGGGNIANLSSATSTVSSIPVGVSTYKWTVTNAGCSTFDFISISAASALPSLPVLSSPSNVSTIAASNVNLFWTNGGGATSYVVVTGTSNPPATSSTSQTSTNYSMGTLSPSTTYYWRVNATNVCGTTTGTVWSFTTLPEFSASASGAQGTCGTGWDSGNTWTGFVKDITVASVPTPLGNGSNQYVLNEVEVELGSDACEKDLSTYFFRLTAPNGTTFIDFFPTSGLTASSNNKWIRVKFRDHAALEMINEYSTLIQNDYFPFSIGYYAIESVDGFRNTFNGVSPNGTWKFAIKENTTDEIAFVKVTLRFGPRLIVQDLSTVNNNDCGNSQCLDTRSVFVGSNNGFAGNDPVWASPNNVSNTLDGCSWNGSNNNSSWFYFTASQSTAKITLSGLRPTTSDDYCTQPLVFTWPGSCSAPSDIPLGGCPNDNAVNNTVYETSGARGAGNAYVNGITANTEFNLSGLNPGTRYVLYVDGNGGNSSSFYIDGFSGMQTCDNVVLPLPIELLSFDAQLENKATHLTWQTATERDNDFFTVERSANGIDWEVLELIDGAGVSNELLHYETYDNYPLKGISYYRLKQTDFDGKATYSDIKSISNTEELMVLPNPGNGIFYVSGLSDRKENQVIVMDVTGKIIANYITEDAMLQMNLEDHPAGIYYVKVNEEFTIKVVKWAND